MLIFAKTLPQIQKLPNTSPAVDRYMLMDRKLLLAPDLLGELDFQLSLLRPMYSVLLVAPRRSACAQVAALERLRQPAHSLPAVEPAN